MYFYQQTKSYKVVAIEGLSVCLCICFIT